MPSLLMALVAPECLAEGQLRRLEPTLSNNNNNNNNNNSSVSKN